MADQEWGEQQIASVGAAYPTKNVRTYMVECGALLDNATKSTPHGITGLNLANIVEIWGQASDGTNVHPLPYTSNADDIAVVITATNVNLITFTDMTAFTSSRVFFSVLQ